MPATLAFFGVTGDVAGWTLAFALKAGYNCQALARTPAKLTESLKQKGVSTDALDKHLTIVQADIRDVEAVKSTLRTRDGVVDKIVSGIGTFP
jgi:putative NADH-flavin reductase